MGATDPADDDITLRRRRLADVRNALERAGVDACILPVTDEYQGEYTAAYARRVAWLSGFDGSAGSVVLGGEKALLLVDGRYTLQAAAQVSREYEVRNSAAVPLADTLRDFVGQGRLGYDPWLHSIAQVEKWQKALEGSGVALVALGENPVDAVWEEKPARPAGRIDPQPLDYAGIALADKLDAAAALIAPKAGSYYVASPDLVCWLLNIRGDDVPHNPVPLVTALVHKEGHADLFAEPSRIDEALRAHFGGRVTVYPPAALADRLRQTAQRSGLAVDPERTPQAIAALLGDHAPIAFADPLIAARAVKNAVEIEGMKRAHALDGAAVTRFLAWYDGLPDDAAPTELEIADMLERFRRQGSEHYRGPSFDTIAGSAGHGAIVHYRATEATSRRVAKDDILLLDSGGQYAFGTTDITRTLCRGTPSRQFKEHFTYVLKGHIALATARFPEGTTGSQLDILARQYLWQNGLDYDHGTGHGVGCYLSVHEGPQRISKKGGDAVLVPGMVLSNEPGYYRAGEYGIRIENLVLVVEKERGKAGQCYLGFETLTKVPIDMQLVEEKLLSTEEQFWLSNYHCVIKS